MIRFALSLLIGIAGSAAAATPVLKRWILPTGNGFVKDPAKRQVRPVVDPPCGDVAYAMTAKAEGLEVGKTSIKTTTTR